MAVRIDISLFDEYKDILLKSKVYEKDYLLIDIRERPYISQVINLQDVMASGVKGKKILLNSPRRANHSNTEYQLDSWEPLINNEVAYKFLFLGFDGFGDYASLKDKLPDSGKGKYGSALALIYDRNTNQFLVDKK